VKVFARARGARDWCARLRPSALLPARALERGERSLRKLERHAVSEGKSRPLRRGLGRSFTDSPTPGTCSNDRHLLFDATVAPAAAEPHERSRARSVRNVP